MAVSAIDLYVRASTSWLKLVTSNNIQYKTEDVVSIEMIREWTGFIVAIKELWNVGMYRESQVLLRSAFEIFLQLIFYLQVPEEKMHKCQCYKIVGQYKRLKNVEKMYKDTYYKQNATIQAGFSQLLFSAQIAYSKYSDEYAKEIKNRIDKTKRKKDWYSIFNAEINDILDLSKIVNLYDKNDCKAYEIYSVIYGSLGRVLAHANAQKCDPTLPPLD